MVAAPAVLDALAARWLDRFASENTRAAYRRDLQQFEKWCASIGRSPLDASEADIARYRDEATDAGVSSATIARRLSALSSFFDGAVAAGAASSNPVMAVARLRAQGTGQRALTDEEATALHAAAVAAGPKAAVLVSLLLLDGMKLGEALALDADEIVRSRAATRAMVRRRGRPSAVALDARTTRALSRYLDGRTTGPLLVGDSPGRGAGARLTRFGADYLVKRAAAAAGLEAVSANTLRRTYIVRSHRQGAAVDDIRQRVGHASVRDTRRYLET